MYKIIACDLDETLLSEDTSICERNKIAIKRAQEKGVKFVLATGRGFISVQKELKEIGLYDKKNEYVISFNGACVTENKDNAVMRFDGLSFEIAKKLFKFGLNYNVCIHVYTKDKLYVYKPDEDETNYLTGRHNFEVLTEPNLDKLKGQEIGKVLYQSLDQDYLREIASKLGNVADELDISYSSNRYLELNHKGVDKGVGLLWLADKLNVNPEETMAIGDNWNDLAMLKAAGLGVGVKNVNPEIKDQCDVVMNSDNNDGGVGEAIERFILSE